MKKIITIIVLLVFLAGCGGNILPQKREPVPPECNLPGNAKCTGLSYAKETGFSVEIENSESFRINNVDLKIEKCSLNMVIGNIPAGGKASFSIPCSFEEDLFESKLIVSYKDADTGTAYLRIGKIVYDKEYKESK
ncbi:hypothetical protein JW707_03390 [Candidatus Woesearchaeota archaeon]|nr:hypothetical protein [Candidatus Woesearchaeota archaeon]